MKKIIYYVWITAGAVFIFICIIILIIYFIWRYSYVSFNLDSIHIISIEKTKDEIKVAFENSESGFYPNKLRVREENSILYVWIGKGLAGISKNYPDITEIIEYRNNSNKDCYYEFTLNLDKNIEKVILQGQNSCESIVLWRIENSAF